MVLFAFAGCNTTTTTTSRTPAAKPAPSSTTAAACVPAAGAGTMGVCAPRPPRTRTLPRIAGTLIPDVSEFQACGLHSEAIFRVYEAGTDRQDATARCHAQELHRLKAWAAVYSFLRSSRSCIYTADRTVAIVRTLPVAVQVVIGDAETGIREGKVRCFLREVERQGYPAREYTCPGCGDEQVGGIWIAAYPFRPAGVWIAHQFSDAFNCRGVVGDCSVDEGILAVRRRDRSALEARRRTLRRVLVSYGCRRRVRTHQPLGPRCRRWFLEGDQVNTLLAR